MKLFFFYLVIASCLSMYRSQGTDCQVELDMDFRGNDLSIQIVSSFQECCTLCDGQLACRAWTFVYNTRRCTLKTEIGTRVATLGSISGQRRTPIVNPITTTCNIESGFVYNTPDLSQPITLSSPSECCDRCGITVGCVAFSYLNDFRLCYLKSALPSLSTQLRYQNSYSGVRNTVTVPPVIVNPVTSAPTDQIIGNCLVRYGYIYPGGDLSGLYLNSFSDCCNRCRITAGCVAWDFLTASKYCFLKQQLPTAQRQTLFANSVSGIRYH